MENEIKIWLIERRALRQVVKCFKENYKVDTVMKIKNFLPQILREIICGNSKTSQTLFL